jgi:hypothetical protein
VVAAEQDAMMDAVIGKTASRQVLGSLNDFALNRPGFPGGS